MASAQSQLHEIPEWMRTDRYWSSALMILIHMAKKDSRVTELMDKYVRPGDGIDWSTIKRITAKWSHSEKILIALAAHLYNDHHKFNLSDLDYLDHANGAVALAAIRQRFRL